MSAGFLFYLVIGLIWMKLEHDTFDWDFEDTSGADKFFCISQQIVHYSRILVAWPFYMVEDALLWFDNNRRKAQE